MNSTARYMFGALALVLIAVAIMPGVVAADVQMWNGTAGAQVWYTHDDADHSGTTLKDKGDNYNLTEVNTPTTGITGAFNEAYDYEKGSTEYAYNASVTLDLTTNISASFWFKPETEASADTVFIYGFNGGANPIHLSMNYRLASTEWLVRIRESGANFRGYKPTTNKIGIGNLTHVVIVWGGQGVRLWLNGTETGLTADVSGGAIPNSANLNDNEHLAISADWDDTVHQSYGDMAVMDEFALFNYSLTQAEITDLSNNNRVGATSGVNCIPTAYDVYPETSPDISSPLAVTFSASDSIALSWTGVYVDNVFYNYTTLGNNTNATDSNYTWPGLNEGNVPVIASCKGDTGVVVNSSTVQYHYDSKNPQVFWTASETLIAKVDNSTDLSCDVSGSPCTHDLNINTMNAHLQRSIITISNSSDFAYSWYQNNTQCTGGNGCQGPGHDWLNFTDTVNNLTVGTWYVRANVTDAGSNNIMEYAQFVISPVSTILINEEFTVDGSASIAAQYMNKTLTAKYTSVGLGNTTSLIENQTADNYLNVIYGTRTGAQSFTTDAGETSVSIVQLEIKRSGAPTFDMGVYIETDNAGEPSGTLVSAGCTTVLDTTALPTSFTDTNFTLDGDCFVTPGTTYWVRFDDANGTGDNSNRIEFLAADIDAEYRGVNYFLSYSSNGGTTWADTIGDDVVFSLFETSSGLVTSATCTATLANTTVLAMTEDASYYNVTYDEPEEDGTNHSVIISCSKTSYETQTATITYGVDYWQDNGFNTADYPDADSYLLDYSGFATNDGQLGNEVSTYHRCTPFRQEGTAVEVGDSILLTGRFIGASGGTRTFTLYPEAVLEIPLYSSPYAICDVTLPTGTGEASCTTTTNTSIALEEKMWACMLNADYIGLDTGGIGSHGLGIGLTTPTWGDRSGVISLGIVSENDYQNVTYWTETSCIIGYTLEQTTGIVINGTNVYAEPNLGSATSDANGYYDICNLPTNQPVYLYASATGYDPWSYSTVKPQPGYINIPEDGTRINLNITMIPTVQAGRVYITATDGNADTFQVNNQYQKRYTLKKDSTIRTIDIEAYDSKDDPLTSGLSVDVTTDCTYSDTPTAYQLNNKGGGLYELTGTFSGTDSRILNAVCAEGDIIDVRIYGAAVDFTGEYRFEGKDMEVRNLIAYTDPVASYGWLQINGSVFDAAGLNDAVNPTACNISIAYTNGTSINASVAATITDNQFSANITTSQSPAEVLITVECTSDGYNDFDGEFILTVSDDWLNWFCSLYNTAGTEVRYHAVGDTIEHRCAFSTTADTALTTMIPYVQKAIGDAWDGDKQLIYKPTLSSGNEYVFSRSFADVSDPARYLRLINLANVPATVEEPDRIFYYDKMVGTVEKPEIISIVASPLIDKGQLYECLATVNYPADFSRTRFWLTINSIDYAFAAEETFVGGIHTYAIRVPNLGNNDILPVGDDALTIYCSGELEFECETCDDYTGLVPLGPASTIYSANEGWDWFGIFGFLQSMMISGADADEKFVQNAVKTPADSIEGSWENAFTDPITMLLTVCIFAILLVAFLAITGRLPK